ncbi:MAG: carbohydrate ABC transporter permease [Clostridiales bacterium]|nr:carbohydrate ABC transporter permease [Clostridiales bacterium]
MIKSLSMLRVKRSMIYLISILLSVLSIFPFYIMIINATRNTYQIQQGLSLLPGSAFMSNWDILMNKNFNVLTGLKNSAIISVGSTVLSVYFSSLAAYGLIVYDFKWKNALFSFIVGIIMIPAQVSAIGFYLYMYRIGWVDSYLPLIIPAIASPATVFFMRQYLKANFQISLVEAARIDGARELFTFNRIVLPIMMPAMATMAIFGFITSWNNYLTPLMLLKNPDMATLPMMVRTLRGDIYRTEYGSIYLGLSHTAAPLLIVYFSLSKYIIQGVALGGVKE